MGAELQLSPLRCRDRGAQCWGLVSMDCCVLTPPHPHVALACAHTRTHTHTHTDTHTISAFSSFCHVPIMVDQAADPTSPACDQVAGSSRSSV